MAFVFLGYRHYHLKRGRARDALVRDTDSGLGILRATVAASAPLPSSDRSPAQTGAPARPFGTDQGEYALDGASRELSRLRRREDLRFEWQRHRRTPFPGLLDVERVSHAPAEIPLLRRKLEAVIEHFGLPPQSHDAKSVVNVIETFRATSCSRAAVELIPIVRGIRQPVRAPPRAPVRAP